MDSNPPSNINENIRSDSLPKVVEIAEMAHRSGQQTGRMDEYRSKLVAAEQTNASVLIQLDELRKQNEDQALALNQEHRHEDERYICGCDG